MRQNGFRNITLHQMEALIRLVETGSFTRAAERMALSQPTLTKHIRNLEDAVGARVVDRKSRGVSLTPEGRILYDYARRIARLREDARERIENLKAYESGHIFLSASTIPATYIIPRFLGLLKKSDPEIRVHIRMGDSEETIQTILGDQAEMGIVGKRSPDRRLKVEPLWQDRLVLAVPAGHPWAKAHLRLLGGDRRGPLCPSGAGLRNPERPGGVPGETGGPFARFLQCHLRDGELRGGQGGRPRGARGFGPVDPRDGEGTRAGAPRRRPRGGLRD